MKKKKNGKRIQEDVSSSKEITGKIKKRRAEKDNENKVKKGGLSSQNRTGKGNEKRN